MFSRVRKFGSRTAQFWNVPNNQRQKLFGPIRPTMLKNKPHHPTSYFLEFSRVSYEIRTYSVSFFSLVPPIDRQPPRLSCCNRENSATVPRTGFKIKIVSILILKRETYLREYMYAYKIILFALRGHRTENITRVRPSDIQTLVVNRKRPSQSCGSDRT